MATATTYTLDSVTLDGIQPTDGLMSGTKWSGTTLTYSFPNAAADYATTVLEKVTYAAMSTAQSNAVKDVLSQVDDVAALTITLVTGATDKSADLRFATSTRNTGSWSYTPSNAADGSGGDVWLDKTSFATPVLGNFAAWSILRETGHALGLKYGEDTGFAGALAAEWDSHEFSVMTTHSHVGGTGITNAADGYAQSLMMLDIAALQVLYGANFNTNSGDTSYSFSEITGAMSVNGVSVSDPAGATIFRTLWDGNGADTYDFSSFTRNLAIDLTPGGWSDLDVGGNAQRADLGDGVFARGHLFNALQYQDDARSLIENANGGAGNDSILGNAAGNALSGNAGDDSLFGGAGDDVLAGGEGADRLEGGSGNNTLNGGAGDDTLVGGSGADVIDGGDGNDRVIFTAALADLSMSVSGTDIVLAGASSATILDTVETVVFADRTFARDRLQLWAQNGGNLAPLLGDDSFEVAERVALTGSLFAVNGGAADIDEDGNAMSVTAIDGAVIMDGEVVTLASGAELTINEDGSFTYDQNGAFDTLEDGQTATDSFTYTVGDGLLETTATATITITGSSAPAGLSLVGTTGKDTLTGADAGDFLSGLDDKDVLKGMAGDDSILGGAGDDSVDGGAGADAIDGGLGNDKLYGKENADSLYGQIGNDFIEGGTGADLLDGGLGNDKLYGKEDADSLIGGDGADLLDGGLANDVLTGGLGNDKLYGKEQDDSLIGGDGADLLDGGIGIDALNGGLGSDKLYGGDGNDELTDGDGVDLLYGGTGNDVLTDGIGKDKLYGGDGNDTLNGGRDADFLYGGKGADVFVITTDTGTEGLKDFDQTVDRIDVTALGLTGLSDFTITYTRAQADLKSGSVILQIAGLTEAEMSDSFFLF